MSIKSQVRMNVLTLIVASCAASIAHGVAIETVQVGNTGNTAEAASGFGAVGYEYYIGKYEVTAGQYAEFLNAVAADDTYALYNENMDVDVYAYGCNIKRAGDAGSYSYTVDPEWANRPVNFVSWADAARFANWLHNGQPTGAQTAGTTEDGAYALNGATEYADLMAVSRDPGATWFLPNQDEWVKAAYHKADGDTGNYWTYPTASDAAPSNALDGGGNNATYDADYVKRQSSGDYTIGEPYYRTEVGAHVNSPSAYGTFDQAGNIVEWSEGVYPYDTAPYTDGLRPFWGGSWGRNVEEIPIDGHSGTIPSYEVERQGFRVATTIPEPGAVVLVLTGLLGWLGLRHRA